MMQLSQLIAEIDSLRVFGEADLSVGKICYDSRQVQEASLFCAIDGGVVDGHEFVSQAKVAGAVAVLSHRQPNAQEVEGVCWLQVPSVEKVREVMGIFSARLAQIPSARLKVAAVTGTNGKTTTAFLIHHLMKQAWHRAGLLSTVLVDLGDPEMETAAAKRTTPESPDLQQSLAQMVDLDCRGVALEASSHAMILERLQGTLVDVGIFTNLSQDHLDFHGSMDAYFEAKAQLFETLATQAQHPLWGEAATKAGKKPWGVIHIDDPWGQKLFERYHDKLRLVTYGQSLAADIRLLDFHALEAGTQMKIAVRQREFLVRLPLLGRYNALNAMAALGAGIACGLNVRESIQNLSEAPQVPGRLELLDNGHPLRVFIDYAHTPDALANVLAALKELPHRRLITIFGCGGNRDAGKRPLMAEAAAALSDLCVLTSDNPRDEDPEAILDQVEKGMGRNKFVRIADRAQAIAEAIGAAHKRDIVLIAGKGHEDYQELANGKRIDFSDQQEARRALRAKAEQLVQQSREWLREDEDWN